MRKPKPIVFFGCVHVGAKTADMEMAKAYVEFVRKRDGYAILLADNHECAVPRKAHMMFEQDQTPQEQLDYSVDLYYPIRRNIKGAVTGNHAWRAYHDAGIEVDKEMMARLGILKHYFRIQGAVELPVGEERYRIAFAHGNNIGSDVFRNCRKLNDQYPRADIFAASHAHILSSLPTQYRDFNGRGGVTLKNVSYISTGSMLNTPLYAEIAMYKPQPKGFAVAWLFPNDHRVDVDTRPDGHNIFSPMF
jgi:hypothetical protein